MLLRDLLKGKMPTALKVEIHTPREILGYNQALSELGEIEVEVDEGKIKALIPDVFCDVPPNTIKVVAYRKGKKSRAILYNLKQENGKDLAQAIKKAIENGEVIK